MSDLFTRITTNPVLRPTGVWKKLYNPAAALDEHGVTHLFPRAIADEVDWHSRIGHAISRDGEHFEWREPALIREGRAEQRGLEDPRVTKIGDTYHMAFAAYDGAHVALHTATALSLDGPWTRHGPALPDFDFFAAGGKMIRFEHSKPVELTSSRRGRHWSKSGAFFSERVDGKYVILFGEYYVWLATSVDGVTFEAHSDRPMLGPRTGTNRFDNVFVETGPPPIETDRGWLVLYHGINERFQYQLGFALFDREDPHQLIYRHDEPILSPQEPYELAHEHIDVARNKNANITPQVVFCAGHILRDSELWLYYGAGDATICAAHAPLADILKLIP